MEKRNDRSPPVNENEDLLVKNKESHETDLVVRSRLPSSGWKSDQRRRSDDRRSCQLLRGILPGSGSLPSASIHRRAEPRSSLGQLHGGDPSGEPLAAHDGDLQPLLLGREDAKKMERQQDANYSSRRLTLSASLSKPAPSPFWMRS